MPAPRPLLALALLATLTTPACHHTPPPKPPSDTTAPEIVEWLLGEQVRGPKTSNRGNVGVVIYDLSAAEPTSTVLPNSCAPDLTRLIPTPDRSGTRFAIDESGQLLRYTGAGWSDVLAPSIDELVAFSVASSRLELLVRTAENQRQLSLLTFEGDEIATIDQVELTTFYDRRETLQRYDSGRCLDGVSDCLHLVAIDGGLILMREPVLYENHEEVKLPLTEGARDVRYTDLAGTKIDVLTADACPSDEKSEPSAEAKPAAEPEPSPEPETAP